VKGISFPLGSHLLLKSQAISSAKVLFIFFFEFLFLLTGSHCVIQAGLSPASTSQVICHNTQLPLFYFIFFTVEKYT
jgi:hypothetical protein